MISSRPRLELQPHTALRKAWRDNDIDSRLAAVSNAAGKAMELATRIAGQMFINSKYSSRLLHQSVLIISYICLVVIAATLVFIFVLLPDTTFYTVARSLSILHIYHDASWHNSRSYGRH
jgi:hypothetical protein